MSDDSTFLELKVAWLIARMGQASECRTDDVKDHHQYNYHGKNLADFKRHLFDLRSKDAKNIS